MFIAMNRFKVVLGEEKNFEEIWKNRKTFLDKVKGFKEFNLVRGEKEKDFSLYASHSVWESKQDFVNWTKSEEFRSAHKKTGGNKAVYLEHPKFEGFEKVL